MIGGCKKRCIALREELKKFRELTPKYPTVSDEQLRTRSRQHSISFREFTANNELQAKLQALTIEEYVTFSPFTPTSPLLEEPLPSLIQRNDHEDESEETLVPVVELVPLDQVRRLTFSPNSLKFESFSEQWNLLAKFHTYQVGLLLINLCDIDTEFFEWIYASETRKKPLFYPCTSVFIFLWMNCIRFTQDCEYVHVSLFILSHLFTNYKFRLQLFFQRRRQTSKISYNLAILYNILSTNLFFNWRKKTQCLYYKQAPLLQCFCILFSSLFIIMFSQNSFTHCFIRSRVLWKRSNTCENTLRLHFP